MKLFLLCDKTKRALPFGFSEWLSKGLLVSHDDPDVREIIITNCAPHVSADKQKFYNSLLGFDTLENRIVMDDAVPAGYNRISGYWETSYIDVPKRKAKK